MKGNLKKLLVIDRTICEYDLNDNRDKLIQEYFDLIKSSYDNYQIDFNSMSEIKNLKTTIFENVCLLKLFFLNLDFYLN
jgi:hypothetical protein